eukprot:TRINITY_DN3591_c0_g1_i8.p1 TRINITY_DN3591_c0_g1~~TRINITY_DN3591_c0_g1_i8.p1  ORF type:complete len:307 (+),score=91.24 TRINITY_DN3591_c0_g1_i8:48-923(+)
MADDYVVGGRKEDIEYLSKQPAPRGYAQLLVKTKVADLLSTTRDVVTVKTTDPLAHAFKLLIQHKILSVPVHSAQKKTYVGLLDMVDIVAHASKIFSAEELKDCKDPAALLDARAQFTNVTCGEVSGVSKRNPYNPIEETAPLQAALDGMVRWKVHRLPVIDGEGKLINIITESALIHFLNENVKQFPQRELSVDALSLGYKDVVISAATNERAIDAFLRMQEKGVSGLPVLKNGKLVGNISVSDLKQIGYSARFLPLLYLSVQAFCKIVNDRDSNSSDAGLHGNVIYVTT